MSRTKLCASQRPNGMLPDYVENYVSKLKESPLGISVLSPGRKGRPLTPGRSLNRIVSVHFPRKNADASRRRLKRGPGKISSHAGGSRCTIQQSWDAPLSPVISGMHSATCGSIQQTTAPRAHQRLKGTSATGTYFRQSPCRAQDEATLLEKLSSLSGAYRSCGEYPKVHALKNAVAIEAVQMKLREHRLGEKTTDSEDDIDMTVGCLVDRNVATVESASRTITRSRRRRTSGTRMVKPPWDNRSPFILAKGVFENSTKNNRLSSAPALQIWTPSDSRSPRDSRFAILMRPSTVAGATRETPASSTCESDHTAGNVRACFKRLTIGALIELNRLHNVPKAVLAVMIALGCLLGLRHRTWYDQHVLFRNAYVLRHHLASTCPNQIPTSRLSSLSKCLESRELAPVRVKRASATAVLMLEWLLAVVACAREGERTKELNRASTLSDDSGMPRLTETDGE